MTTTAGPKLKVGDLAYYHGDNTPRLCLIVGLGEKNGLKTYDCEVLNEPDPYVANRWGYIDQFSLVAK